MANADLRGVFSDLERVHARFTPAVLTSGGVRPERRQQPASRRSGNTRERLVNQPATVSEQFDAVAVGAGFSGLYMLDRLRRLGMSVRVFDSADDVGGTWYWNRYLGARCDIPTTDYAYSFDPELERDWTWPEKYATQPEILDYLRFVADRHGLRSDIEFSTAVVAARWEEEEPRWTITTGRGTQIRRRYYIMASGCL
jgi:cation diffusion facilitator CzcD-associated flavoprotein CzcO